MSFLQAISASYGDVTLLSKHSVVTGDMASGYYARLSRTTHLAYHTLPHNPWLSVNSTADVEQKGKGVGPTN
jgi:hypothetical protein